MPKTLTHARAAWRGRPGCEPAPAAGSGPVRPTMVLSDFKALLPGVSVKQRDLARWYARAVARDADPDELARIQETVDYFWCPEEAIPVCRLLRPGKAASIQIPYFRRRIDIHTAQLYRAGIGAGSPRGLARGIRIPVPATADLGRAKRAPAVPRSR